MSSQFSEYYQTGTGLTVGINRKLYSKQTDYQLIEIYETTSWGNMMTIDGMVMLSEIDEFVYHEMLTHVSMFTHPAPEQILVIGGGDGGTAREVLKHDSVKRVDLVEIDRYVVEAAKKYLPDVGDFENPKLNVLYQNGVDFVKNSPDKYDLVIIDGSDPVGPAEGLFQQKFFRDCTQLLTRDGILVTQTGSPWVSSFHPEIRNTRTILKDLYPFTHMYLCHIPLYPAGMWSMMMASKSVHPQDKDVISRVENSTGLMRELKYYNRDIHQAAFALPDFVRKLI